LCIGHPQNCNAQGNAKISGTPHTLDRYVSAWDRLLLDI